MRKKIEIFQISLFVIGKSHVQDGSGMEKPVDMLGQPEYDRSPVRGIGADPLEDGASVMEGVRHRMDMAVLPIVDFSHLPVFLGILVICPVEHHCSPSYEYRSFFPQRNFAGGQNLFDLRRPGPVFQKGFDDLGEAFFAFLDGMEINPAACWITPRSPILPKSSSRDRTCGRWPESPGNSRL